MNKVINELWDELYNHPLFSEDIARKIKTEVRVGVTFGMDKSTLTRNLLIRTRDFLDMMQRIERRHEGRRKGSEKGRGKDQQTPCLTSKGNIP